MDRTRCPGSRFSVQFADADEQECRNRSASQTTCCNHCHRRLSTTETLTVATSGADYQSEYFVPSRAVASEPLLTSYTPAGALGLVGSGSLATVCHVEPLIVNGSSGTFRR